MALVLVLLAAGCASLGLGSGAEPLLERAKAAIEAGEEAKAYDLLARIRREHPESAEAETAYPLATSIYRKMYYRYRYAEPEGRWLTSEPEFLFDWLASRVGDDSPEASARQLLFYLPQSFAERFLAYAEDAPALAAWEIEVEEDNGRVNHVSARRRAGGASEGS